MSDTGSGAPNPFSREGSEVPENWPAYPPAPLPPPGFDPEPFPPYPSTRSYEAAPIDGAYGSNPYEVNQYQVNPYQLSYGGSSPYGVVPTQHPQAVTALVLGILGLVLGSACAVGGLFGIGGIVLGRRARREIDAEPGRFTGRGAATAGLVTGVIGIVVGLLYAIFFVAIFALSGTSGDF